MPRFALCVRLKSWPFEDRSSCSNCIKIFLVAIAEQLDTLWHTALDDMYTFFMSVATFGCQRKRQSEALKRTWGVFILA